MENLRQVFQICQQLVDQILQKQSLSSNFSHQNEFLGSFGHFSLSYSVSDTDTQLQLFQTIEIVLMGVCQLDS